MFHTFRASLMLAALFAFTGASTLQAASIIGLPEGDAWSDMNFATGVSGSYTAGTLDLSITAAPSNNLDIGVGTSADYGSGGSQGGAFAATLTVSGVDIANDGSVIDGGLVEIVFNGGAPGVGTDYGVLPGGTLLTGVVTEVGLGATGAGTLDIAFDITGGGLQNPGVLGPFSTAAAPQGLMRFVGGGLPADWTADFSFNSTLNVFGIPEPTSMVLMATVMTLFATGRKTR